MEVFLLFIFLSLIQILKYTNSLSYSVEGIWKEPSRNDDCNKHYICTPSNATWSTGAQFYDHKSGCEALLSKGISKIYFHGDSFMRQMYAAMFITLSGNYQNGSLINSEASIGCEYHKQFNEKKCGTRQLNHNGLVCDGKILLDPLLIGLDSLTHCSTDSSNVVLWSFGNYKTTRHGRHGVNNATAYSELFQHSVCPRIASNTNSKCSVWWISTHYRLQAHFPDEGPEVVKAYNEGMKEFFANEKSCGAVNYIDVYNMTRALAVDFIKDAEQMTYDRVHWGMEVNLIKAQIILNALMSRSP